MSTTIILVIALISSFALFGFYISTLLKSSSSQEKSSSSISSNAEDMRLIESAKSLKAQQELRKLESPNERIKRFTEIYKSYRPGNTQSSEADQDVLNGAINASHNALQIAKDISLKEELNESQQAEILKFRDEYKHFIRT